MPAQTGYFDTLKSVAGKVFSFLSTITLTGTDGKTITLTQDTSLDEAVAMSSKAPKTATIAGDGTAGRVIRQIQLRIDNGTTGVGLKCRTVNLWNGDVNAELDNILKNATTGIYSLNASGQTLTLLNAGISGDCVAVLSAELTYNLCGTALVWDVQKGAGGILVVVSDSTSGAALDMTTLVDTGKFFIHITYVTSA